MSSAGTTRASSIATSAPRREVGAPVMGTNNPSGAHQMGSRFVRAARDCNRQRPAKGARRSQNIRIEAAVGHPGRIEADEEKVISFQRLFRHRVAVISTGSGRVLTGTSGVRAASSGRACRAISAPRLTAEAISLLWVPAAPAEAGGPPALLPAARAGSAMSTSQTRRKLSIRMVGRRDQKSLHVGHKAFGFESLPLQPFALAGPHRCARQRPAEGGRHRRSRSHRDRRSLNRGPG